MMLNRERVYKFMAEHRNQLLNREYEALYYELGKLFEDAEDAESIGFFTKILWDIDENPLENLDYIPAGFASGLPIKTFSVPNNIKTIYRAAFLNCSNLENITLHDGLINLKGRCFENCIRLKNIVIPKSVQSISQGVFLGCINLNNVVFNGSVSYIGDFTFNNCNALKELQLPNGVETLNLGAIDFTPKLQKLYIGSGLQHLLDNVDNTGLKEIVVNDTKENFMNARNRSGFPYKNIRLDGMPVLIKCLDDEFNL